MNIKLLVEVFRAEDVEDNGMQVKLCKIQAHFLLTSRVLSSVSL